MKRDIYTEEHDIFRDAFRKFLEKEVVPHQEEWIKADDPRVTRFAIDTLDGVHIGQCSLRASAGHERVSEVGLFIGEKEYWGRGYGADAVVTLCTFGFAYQNLDRIAL